MVKIGQHPSNPDKILVSVPGRNVIANQILKNHRSVWDPCTKLWMTSKLNQERIELELNKIFGNQKLHLKLKEKIEEYREPIYISGFEICRAFGRDSGAKFAPESECVEVICGEAGSGGSVKNWTTKLYEGAEVILRFVSKDLEIPKEWEVLSRSECPEEGV
jgi:hypothetical protein